MQSSKRYTDMERSSRYIIHWITQDAEIVCNVFSFVLEKGRKDKLSLAFAKETKNTQKAIRNG